MWEAEKERHAVGLADGEEALCGGSAPHEHHAATPDKVLEESVVREPML